MRLMTGVILLAAAGATGRAEATQELWPGATYDARIPTLEATIGHAVGEEVSSPEEITIYLKALAAAAPERTRLVEYARSWEGRPLHVSSSARPSGSHSSMRSRRAWRGSPIHAVTRRTTQPA